MAIPDSVEHVTVSSGEALTLPDGTPMQGRLRFRAPLVNVVPPDDYLFGGQAAVDLVDGHFTIDLVPQDATGIDPTGWSYEVVADLDNGLRWRRFMTLTKDEPEVFLADVLDPMPDDPSFDSLYLPLTGGTMTGSITFTAGDLTLSTPQMQATLSELLVATLDTGVLRGGVLTPNAVNPHAVDISAVVAFVVDQYTDPLNPTVTRVEQPAKTIQLDAAGLARSVTWYVMDAVGNVTMQGLKPTAVGRRDAVLLGGVVYDPVLDELTVVQTLPTILAQPVNQLYDLMSALGGFRIEGLDVSPNGTNLQMDLAAGRMFTTSFNHDDNGGLTQDPHEVSLDARTVFSFRHITRSFTTTPPLTSVLDVNNYDLNGTVTSMPNNRFQVFRIWMVGNKSVTTDMVVQYGQTTYNSMDDALASIGIAPYEVDEVVRANLALIAYVAVQQGTTNLSDPTAAQFRRPMKFADA